jgi:hypothetical protein
VLSVASVLLSADNFLQITPLPSKSLKRVQDMIQMLRRSLLRRLPLAAMDNCTLVKDTKSLVFGRGDDPESYTKAAPHVEWRQAMKEEFSFLVANTIWEFVDISKLNCRKAIGCRWVFKTKNNHDGLVSSIQSSTCYQR